MNRRWARAKLPKFGWVRFRITRPLGGTVKNATISRDGKHWYISFLVEDGLIEPERHANPGSAVGIDRGVAKVVTRSDGSPARAKRSSGAPRADTPSTPT
ncbi:hypothetical protein [Nonomuraea sp. NPDC049158]|uniref:hypothetical protein n=1 Tax=Nonomuraea sp. NPDC049158 TaxID=3155649 RepID=UPI0033EAB9DF